MSLAKTGLRAVSSVSAKRRALPGKPIGQFPLQCSSGKGCSSTLTVSAMTQAFQPLLKLSVVAVSSLLNLKSRPKEFQFYVCCHCFGNVCHVPLNMEQYQSLSFATTSLILGSLVLKGPLDGSDVYLESLRILSTVISLEQQHWIHLSQGKRWVTLSLISHQLYFSPGLPMCLQSGVGDTGLPQLLIYLLSSMTFLASASVNLPVRTGSLSSLGRKPSLG